MLKSDAGQLVGRPGALRQHAGDARALVRVPRRLAEDESRLASRLLAVLRLRLGDRQPPAEGFRAGEELVDVFAFVDGPEATFAHCADDFRSGRGGGTEHGGGSVRSPRRAVRPKILVFRGVVCDLVSAPADQGRPPTSRLVPPQRRPPLTHPMDDRLIPWTPILEERVSLGRQALDLLARDPHHPRLLAVGDELVEVVAHERRVEAVRRLALAKDEADELVLRVDGEDLGAARLASVLETVEALDRGLGEQEAPDADAAVAVVDHGRHDEADAPTGTDQASGPVDEVLRYVLVRRSRSGLGVGEVTALPQELRGRLGSLAVALEPLSELRVRSMELRDPTFEFVSLVRPDQDVLERVKLML